MKTFDDLYSDTIKIEGLVDGLDALWDNPDHGARNAMIPIMSAAKQALGNLADDIEGMQKQETSSTKPTEAIQVLKPKATAKVSVQDALACLHQIHSLAQFGIAAADTTSGISVKDNSSLYEEISRLADVGADAVQTKPQTAA